MKKFAAIFLLMCASLAHGQNGRYDNVALGPKGVIPGANVAVCTQPANTSTTPCTPLANLCSSLTDVVCGQPNPFKADSLGNFHFYAPLGNGPFTYQLYGPAVAAPVAFADQGATFGSSGKNVTADHTQYVTTSGNDSNDGLSWSTAKATPQAAFNAATNSGTNSGIVILGCSGTGNGVGFTGPTTWYNGLSVFSYCSSQVPGAAQTAFEYTSNLTLASITGVSVQGIVFDFNYTGSGLIIGNSVQANTFSNVTLKNCGSNAPVACMAFNVTGTTSASNSLDNSFDTLTIYPNNNSGQWADCLTMTGAGPVNAGGFPTDNFFWDVTCQGNIRYGIREELNTDTNYFSRFFVFNVGPTQTNSACLALNLNTPASDQDADGGRLDGLICQGGFTNTFRLGQSTGYIIQMTAGSTPTVSVQGGTPLYTLHLIGLPGINSNIMVGGTLSASGIAGSTGGASGAVAGDVSAIRASGTGALFLGNDGAGFVFRNSTNTGQFQFGSSNVWNLNNVGQSGSIPMVVQSGTVSVTPGNAVGCVDQTATATGASTAMTVLVSPVSPQANTAWSGYVSAANTVDVHVCTIVALTGSATTYNWKVITN